MPTIRHHLVGGVVGNRIHYVGGRPPENLSVHEAYDVGTGTWVTLAPMPTGRSSQMGTSVNGCLYMMGGQINAAREEGTFGENEVYDSRNNTWQAVVSMKTPRHATRAVAVGNRIYVPAGSHRKRESQTTETEAFVVPRDLRCQ